MLAAPVSPMDHQLPRRRTTARAPGVLLGGGSGAEEDRCRRRGQWRGYGLRLRAMRVSEGGVRRRRRCRTEMAAPRAKGSGSRWLHASTWGCGSCRTRQTAASTRADRQRRGWAAVWTVEAHRKRRSCGC
jgi:hypothetical protein